MRHFNSYGPVDLRVHYGVPRTGLVERCVSQLVGAPEEEGGHYFTIWAPRQTGKTWLMRRAIQEIRLRYGDRFLVGAISAQSVVLKDGDPPDAFLGWVPDLFRRGMQMTVPRLESWQAWGDLFLKGEAPFDRPLILLIDEFDKLPSAVIDQLVTSFRDLYLTRETSLLHGLALIGVRAVLGVDSPRGSPFNVQRSLHVPNLTVDEVTEMFRQYQAESGQQIEADVVASIYEVTRGQPGLVGWFGELLTEKYNRSAPATITMREWNYVYGAACQVEPNNTVLNLLRKARTEPYRDKVVDLFRRSNVPFAYDQEWCNYLYLNGIIDHQETSTPDGQVLRVCRFSCPFIQLRLYRAFTQDLAEVAGQVPVVDPHDDLTGVLARLDLPALLGRYRDFLKRLKDRGQDPWRGQPRRADMHVTEAVGHFHLYWWLMEVGQRQMTISPEFPTGNGKVNLHVRYLGRAGVIEVKSFTQRHELPAQKEQAARYARGKGLPAATLAIFVPTDDEDLLAELSTTETIEGVVVSTVAISAV